MSPDRWVGRSVEGTLGDELARYGRLGQREGADQVLERVSDSAEGVVPARMPELVEIGARVFAENGFDRTTVSDLARAFGVQKATFYHYFESKEDLLQAVLQTGIVNLYEQATRAVATEREPIAQLGTLLDCHVRHVEQAGSRLILFLVEQQAVSEPFRSEYLGLRRKYNKLFVDVIRRGQELGVFEAGNPSVMAYGILGMYNWLVQWYQPTGALKLPAIHEGLKTIALRGIAARATSEAGPRKASRAR